MSGRLEGLCRKLRRLSRLSRGRARRGLCCAINNDAVVSDEDVGGDDGEDEGVVAALAGLLLLSGAAHLDFRHLRPQPGRAPAKSCRNAGRPRRARLHSRRPLLDSLLLLPPRLRFRELRYSGKLLLRTT